MCATGTLRSLVPGAAAQFAWRRLPLSGDALDPHIQQAISNYNRQAEQFHEQ
jgi:hypothetical protein